MQSVQSNCNAGGLQSDCGDCSLIAEIAKVPQHTYTVGQSHGVSATAISAIQMQSVQSNCNAGGLQSDCGDCSLITEIAKVLQLTYTVGQSHGVSVTAISTIQLQSPQSNCNLHNPTAMQEDCSLIVEIAV